MTTEMEQVGSDMTRTAGLPGAPAGRASVWVWIQILCDAFLAIASLILAFSPSIADGRVEFAAEAWRWLLGGLGLFFSLISLRSMRRVLTDYQPHIDVKRSRTDRFKGKMFAAMGLWFLALAVVSPLAENTISFTPWLKVGYAIAGAMNLLVGLLIHWDPTRHIQTERVRAGEGLRGRARILRANDTGTSINEAPQVKIDFMIEVHGKEPYEASDKIVVQQAKLALLIPGSTLGVVADGANPDIFHLDWDDWKPPSDVDADRRQP